MDKIQNIVFHGRKRKHKPGEFTFLKSRIIMSLECQKFVYNKLAASASMLHVPFHVKGITK